MIITKYIYTDLIYIEIPATTEKSRILQEILQELAGIYRNVRILQECQEFAGMSGEWQACLDRHPNILFAELELGRSS